VVEVKYKECLHLRIRFPGGQKDRLICLVPLLLSAIPVLSRGALARLHAEQPAHGIHPSDHQLIEHQNHGQGERTNDQPFGQDSHRPLHHVEGDHDDHRLLQHVERQHRFVGRAEHLAVPIEPAHATGEDEDEPGPGIDAVHQLIEQGAGGVAGGEFPGHARASEDDRPYAEEG